MNILILSASIGGGHMKAAETLSNYILSDHKEVEVKVIDTLEYVSPSMNKIVSNGYVFLVRNMNFLYKVFYEDTDRKSLISVLVTKALIIIAKKLLQLIKDFKADVVITTHPFSTEIISILKEDYKIQIPHICIMTDYAAHNTWIKKNVDGYCVACEDMIGEMVARGVHREKIHPFGIPVSKEFFEGDEKDKSQLINSLGLKQIRTILIMAGSFGVDNIEDIFRALLTIEEEFQIIIITGNNDKLYNRIRNIKQDYKKAIVVKYTNEVSRYMNIADILITKPGGLTISEALASNLPMVIFNAIPGQEESNSRFLIKHGMAISVGQGDNCNKAIEKLLKDKNKLENLKYNCRKFNKEKSCSQIMELIEGLVKKNREKNEIA